MIRILIFFFCLCAYGQSGYKFVTDFETTQWDDNGTVASGEWETSSRSDVRVVFDAYEGSRAIWLGDFISPTTRNEISLSDLIDREETWWGFAMRVEQPVPADRTYFQLRPLRASGGVGDGVTNLITIRQGTTGRMYIQTSTIFENRNTIYNTGANPTGCCDSFFFDYTVGQWITIVVHSIFDDVNGRLELWIDGEKLIDVTGTTAYNFAHDDGEPYDTNRNVAQMGPYWASAGQIGDAYYDKFSVWEGSDGTYELVHPLGLSPGAGGGTPPLIPSTGTGKQKTGTAQLIAH